MEYWSDDEKDYIKRLTRKRIFFTGIRGCYKISLDKISDCYDIILAKSNTKIFYLAFKADSYVGQLTTSVPSDLRRILKANNRKGYNLTGICPLKHGYNEYSVVFIPSNNSLLEVFFKEPDKYFTMEAII